MDTQNSYSASARNLVRRAVDQLRYPCCFGDFVNDLQGQEDEMIKKQDDVKERLKQSKTQVINVPVVHAWLEREANPLKGSVEKLLKEATTRTNKSCCFVRCPNWIWRHQMAKKLAEKKVEVQNYIKEGDMYIQIEDIVSSTDTQDLPSEKPLTFDSRNNAYQQLLEALKNDNITTVGLYGMGGCGKTTMAMELKTTIEAENLFNEVHFVTISNNSKLEVRSIQDKIAKVVQIPFKTGKESERAKDLRTRLSLEHKRILMVFDDVWQVIDFGAIGIPSGENHKNFKVLITTRSGEVCDSMKCQGKIFLPTLTEEDAWTLFKKLAHISEGTSNSLIDLGRQISKECKGLPVAIAALAGTLKGKVEGDWKDALDRLRNSIPVNIEKSLQNPYNCLRVSYDNLDIEEAKSLLLLCSVFPEDDEIPVEYLTRIAIGLGLVGEVQSFEAARDKVSAAMNELISSCLLSRSKAGAAKIESSALLSPSDDDYEEECVKMHDLVRDVAIWIASEENKAVKCLLEEDMTLECDSIRYLWCKEFPNELDCSSMEFLSIRTNSGVSDEIFKGMGRLRVLNLCYTGFDFGSLSTMSFKSLTNLRCLFLKRWELDDISSVGNMKMLESLTLHDCSFLELPDVLVTHLRNLRLLHLSKCGMKTNPFEVIGRHSLLEALYFHETENKKSMCEPAWDYFFGETTVESEWTFDQDHAEFFKKFNVPQALKRYQIKLGDTSCSVSLNGNRTLALNCLDTSNVAVMDLAKKAEALYVADIKGGGENIIPDIFQMEGARVMNSGWTELWLNGSNKIKCLVDTSNHSQEVGTLFSKLRKLTIEQMDHLGALCRGVPPNGLFKTLKHLNIEGCPMLTCLFTSSIARNLAWLESLEISECEGLRHLLADEDIEDTEIRRQDNKLVFSELRKVNIRKCSMLEYIIPVTFAQGLVQLETLEIHGCIELEYVFRECTRGNLNQKQLRIELAALKNLELVKNSKMISIFPQYCSATLPFLCYFYLQECPEFDIMSRNTFKASNWRKVSQLQDVSSIEKHFLTSENMTIEGNSKIESIFSLDGLEKIGQPMSLRIQDLVLQDLCQMKYICVGLKNSFTFQNLKRLQIIGCDKLEVIFHASVLRCLPELQHLEIRKCQELKQIIEENKKESSDIVSPWPCFAKLATIIIGDCNNLKRLLPVSASNDLANLEFLNIEGAKELEELVGYEQGQGDRIGNVKVELPKLKLLVLEKLSSFCQGIEFPTLTARVIHCCPKLSLSSSVATIEELEGKLYEWKKESLSYSYWMEVRKITCEAYSIIQKQLGETGTTIKIPPYTEQKIKEDIQEDFKLEDAMKAAMSAGTDSNDLPAVGMTRTETGTSQNQKMQNVDYSIQEGSNSIDNEDTQSSCSLIVAKLEAFKHSSDLDDAQIALLAEAIAVYPHLWKVIDKFSTRFQSLKLKTVVDMLFFLRNESTVSVTTQQENEFEELCDEAIQLGFDNSWVDEMRQRVMVRDPGVEHAQTRLRELTQELGKINDEIDNLRQFVDSKKKCFDFL